MSSGVTTWPLRKTASLVTPGMIWVMSWQRMWPTAFWVSMSFMVTASTFRKKSAQKKRACKEGRLTEGDPGLVVHRRWGSRRPSPFRAGRGGPVIGRPEGFPADPVPRPVGCGAFRGRGIENCGLWSFIEYSISLCGAQRVFFGGAAKGLPAAMPEGR